MQEGYVLPGYVGPATPIPPTTDNPSDEAEHELAQAVEFGPAAEDTENATASATVPLQGVSATGVPGTSRSRAFSTMSTPEIPLLISFIETACANFGANFVGDLAPAFEGISLSCEAANEMPS